MSWDVVVVGAGLSGFAAARAVAAEGRSVVVVEARDRVGGRTEGGTLADGQWIELGGQWVGPTQDRMYALLDELGLRTVPTWNDGDIVFGLGRRTGRLAGRKGAVPRLNPVALADLAQGVTRFGAALGMGVILFVVGAAYVFSLDYLDFVDFLTGNGPWSLLVEAAHVDLRTLTPDRPIELAPDLRVTPFIVPHRDEFTDTVGYRIDGPRASALYLPDIDRWDLWDRDIRDVVAGVDLAFLDGTFASPDEVPGRSIEQISHPLIPDTRARLRDSGAEVWFIHLNHTNAELDGAPDVAREGMEFEL